MTTVGGEARTVSARGTLAGRLRDIVRYRELLTNLVRLELKAKYKSSALGFVWSLVDLRPPVGWAYIPLLPLALFALLILMAALVLFLSAANVYLRDIQHFVELALLAWFWLTPIVYLFTQLTSHLHNHLALALINP